MLKIKIDVNTYNEESVAAALGDGGYAGRSPYVDLVDMCTLILEVPYEEIEYFRLTVNSLIERNIGFVNIRNAA